MFKCLFGEHLLILCQVPMHSEHIHSICLASEIKNVSHVEAIVVEAISEGVCEDNFGKILIALTEAVNNAILHGNCQDPQKNVFISYETAEQMVYFNIKDEGQGFNPQEIPDPTDPENIDKPNGRGVFLMQRLSDHCEFLNSGNEVRLGFKLQPES